MARRWRRDRRFRRRCDLGRPRGAGPYGYYGPGYYYGPAYAYEPDYAYAPGWPRGRWRGEVLYVAIQSYDPESGTYLGYDGHRHPCP